MRWYKKSHIQQLLSIMHRKDISNFYIFRHCLFETEAWTRFTIFVFEKVTTDQKKLLQQWLWTMTCWAAEAERCNATGRKARKARSSRGKAREAEAKSKVDSAVLGWRVHWRSTSNNQTQVRRHFITSFLHSPPTTSNESNKLAKLGDAIASHLKLAITHWLTHWLKRPTSVI